MNQLSDELIFEFIQGRAHGFQAIFDSFRMRIFYFVKKLTDDVPAAEEITSDTFVKLYRLHDKFNTRDNIQSFLFITARNASIDFIKYRKRQREYVTVLSPHEEDISEMSFFPESNVEADVLQHIYDEIEKLPKRTKTVFKLFYLEDLSLAEIATIMKISQQTVANLKTTALKNLRIKLLDKPKIAFLFFWLIGEHGL